MFERIRNMLWHRREDYWLPFLVFSTGFVVERQQCSLRVDTSIFFIREAFEIPLSMIDKASLIRSKWIIAPGRTIIEIKHHFEKLERPKFYISTTVEEEWIAYFKKAGVVIIDSR